MVVWAFAHLNIGQHYDGTTGEYSAPYNGTYMFQLHMYKKDQAGMVSCRLRKNTGTIATAIVPSETVKQGIYESSTSAIVLLKEGDKVYVGDCDNFENMNYLTAFNGVLLDKD